MLYMICIILYSCICMYISIHINDYIIISFSLKILSSCTFGPQSGSLKPPHNFCDIIRPHGGK